MRGSILPFEAAVSHLPKIFILDSAVNNICHGSPLAVHGISKITDDIQKNSMIAIMTLKNELVSLGNSMLLSEEIKDLKKGVIAKPTKVFMERNIYN